VTATRAANRPRTHLTVLSAPPWHRRRRSGQNQPAGQTRSGPTSMISRSSSACRSCRACVAVSLSILCWIGRGRTGCSSCSRRHGVGTSCSGSRREPDDRYSSLFKLTRVRPLTVAEQIAEAAVKYPAVPIVFAETRQLAQERTYRFFGAAIEHRANEAAGTPASTPCPRRGPFRLPL
jgi:hypothetical protein